MQDGIFVASLTRPDKSIKTWWRTPIDETARKEPALEVFLPEKATLSDLHPSVLAPGVLAGSLDRQAVTVADVVGYFSGGRRVMVQRQGYEEPVVIPACRQPAVEAASFGCRAARRALVRQRTRELPGRAGAGGRLTASAQLRAPMSPLSVDSLTQDAVPEAWKDGQTTALALSVGLAAQTATQSLGRFSVARSTMRSKPGWIGLAGPGSGLWPCESAGAPVVVLKQPAGAGVFGETPGPGEFGARPKGVIRRPRCWSRLPFQDLVDVLPEVIKAAAGSIVQLSGGKSFREMGRRYRCRDAVQAINKRLEQVSCGDVFSLRRLDGGEGST